VGSFSNPDNQAPHSSRPLDEIVKWYAILEERHQEFDWGRVDHIPKSPTSAVNPESRPPSLRAGRQKILPVPAHDAPLDTNSTAETTVDENPPVSNRQETVVGSSSRDEDAEEWKHKILELVQKSKRLPGKIDSQSQESVQSSVEVVFPPKRAATPETVASASHQQALPPEAIEPQTDEQPPTTRDFDSQTDPSSVLGASVLSIVDSGLYEDDATVHVGEQGRDGRYGPESATVDSRTVDAYESSLREAMEAFEDVVRSMARGRAVPESTNVKPNEVMYPPEHVVTTSPLSSEREIHVQPKREAAHDPSGENGAASDSYSEASASETMSNSGLLGGVRLGLSRSTAPHDKLDAIAAKLVAESVAMKDARNPQHAVASEATDSQATVKPATPLPHTRMGASRLRLTAQVNHLLSKYVISADESFEEFVVRHQKAIKHEVLQQSSHLFSKLSSLWSKRSSAWLEPLRVPRLHDLWLLDVDEDADVVYQKSTIPTESRRPWERLRVSRLRDLWNVDLDSEMNVREEPLERNPFEPLRVDRLRELWLVDDL
jgi:hypothetical protein